jgi:hypothetical protein
MQVHMVAGASPTAVWKLLVVLLGSHGRRTEKPSPAGAKSVQAADGSTEGLVVADGEAPAAVGEGEPGAADPQAATKTAIPIAARIRRIVPFPSTAAESFWGIVALRQAGRRFRPNAR